MLWDGDRDLLLAARDPLGLHPLFWAQGGGRLHVASSFTALRRHPDVADELDREVLAEFIAFRFLDAHETVVRAIRRVPPGHVLRVAGGPTATTRYWHPGPRNPEDWVTEDRLEEFDALFARAIDRSLATGRAGHLPQRGPGLRERRRTRRPARGRRRDGAPVGALARLPGRRVERGGRPARRRRPARAAPAHAGAGGGGRAPRGDSARRCEASPSYPAPLTNYWTPAYERLARDGGARGCQVILTGTGGDEWLGVTPYYAADLLRRGDVRGLVRLWANLQRSYPVPRALIARNLLWRFGARDLLAAQAVRALRRAAPGLLRRRRLERLDGRTPAWLAPEASLRRTLDERALAALPEPRTKGLYWRELDEALDHPLTSLEVEETYETGRRSGVPVVPPFWDADLISFLVRTPPELLNRGGRSKGVVRDMVARQVPGFGFERQRKVSASGVATATVLDTARAGLGAARRCPQADRACDRRAESVKV